MSQDHIALSAEREANRGAHQLRLVKEKEEGARIERLPEGVYGFSNSPSSPELPLFAKPMYRSFEVQKRRGGEVVFVGYATPQERLELEQGRGPLSLRLYPDLCEHATELVEVPLSRVDRRRYPSRDEGNAMRLEVAPA